MNNLCVPEFIYLFPFKVHLCVCQSKCLCLNVNSFVPEFLYVLQSSFRGSRIHLSVPKFIYGFMGSFMCSRVNFMCSRGHLCVPEVIYVFQVSCMCSRVHLRVPELIYVFLSSCLCSLCVPDSRMPFCFPDCIDVFHFSFLPCKTGKCRSLPFIRKCPRNLIK